MKQRLRELDFLRGIAIVLVLLRHFPLFDFTERMGWIGVDLFFVLSGFLVSGLLFKEYIKFGNIKPGLFLIRRGFKIYPIYYIFYIPYLAFIIHTHRFNLTGFLSDMTFTQNYIWGWGYAYTASWSLAVEEHFYFGLTFFLWFLLRYKAEALYRKTFVFTIVSLLILCLILRIIWTDFFYINSISLFTQTHFRIDSLLFGVLISYFYYFKNERLKSFLYTKKTLLLTVMFLGVCWTPFIDPMHSDFVKTFGFTLLYISFGILLAFFLFIQNINVILDRFLSKMLVNLISKIGFCSYSIYIIHILMMGICNQVLQALHIELNHYLLFILGAVSSVLAGIIMTNKVEKYFLNLRNRYYPSRI